MPRWEQGTQNRLVDAAMFLFEEQGFGATSAVQIAERAGVTTRTFFRYFPDKPAVLFVDADRLHGLLVGAIESDESEGSPLEVVLRALGGFPWLALGSRAMQRRRDAMITEHRELLERELIKHDEMAATFSAALQRRGSASSVADLAAHVGIALFRTAYRAWLTSAQDIDLASTLSAATEHLVQMSPAVSPSLAER